jgi:hypothetical protein
MTLDDVPDLYEVSPRYKDYCSHADAIKRRTSSLSGQLCALSPIGGLEAND